MLSQTEENYIKTIHTLTQEEPEGTSTNATAEKLDLKPATVSAMLVKLKDKKLIHYEKYGKIRLTVLGLKTAMHVIRKHRIWELFLVDKLGFAWDEVHEVAEQLEHIQSEKLVDKLDALLGYPKADPHGDPIPDKDGKMPVFNKRALSEIGPGKQCTVVGTKDSSPAFLKYLTQMQIRLTTVIKVLDLVEFDNSMLLEINGKKLTVSNKVAENLWVSL
jgi:DtxR family transcriptional regulator, Mn-dependent transcriptional regulator